MAVTKRKAKKTKTVAKKKAPTRRRRRDSHIRYRCILGRCTAIPKRARIGEVGDSVKLEAKKTNAQIRFRRGRSPFSVVQINLRDGVPVTKRIVNRGTFEYNLTCSACSGRLSGPPSMIVD
jgi:hypothetical protein